MDSQPTQPLILRSNVGRTVAMLSVAAGLLFFGLAVLVASDSDEPETRVAGVQAENPSVPAGTDEPVSTLVTEPPSTAATTDSVVPPASQPAPTVQEMRVARFEHGAFFTHRADPSQNVAGSATVVVRNEGEVAITVAGSAEGDRAVIRATVENATASPIEFPGGLTVKVEIDRDGAPWRVLEPSDRSVTTLAPGETVTVSTEVALDVYGEYSLSGEVQYQVA